MANAKARAGTRSAQGARAAQSAKAARAARSAAAVAATPTSSRKAAPKAVELELDELDEEPWDNVETAPRRTGMPAWLQWITLVLAVVGLGISAYETWAHFNGNHLAGCPTGHGGTFNCAAVITSPQSMVFGHIPVAILGLIFYVAAIPLFSPWAWRTRAAIVHRLRLVSLIVGMGFVVYLIYAELTIGSICEYCTGVHIVTFLLFVATVFSAAIWGLRGPEDAAE
jgi:uncharacterized membrane protein